MSEIPMEEARDAWTELAATKGGRDAEEMVIHRAIMAERDRCVKLLSERSADVRRGNVERACYANAVALILRGTP